MATKPPIPPNLEGAPAALPAGKLDTDTSIANMLFTQFSSKELNDVWGSSEFREQEIPALSSLFMVRAILMAISTTEEEVNSFPPDSRERADAKLRLQLKEKILSDPNAMMFSVVDDFLYAFGLLRQSLGRKSRHEAVNVSVGGGRVMSREEIGWGQAQLSKLGLGRYTTAFVRK